MTKVLFINPLHYIQFIDHRVYYQ